MEIRVTTHSGEDRTIEVENYNPVELNNKINDKNIHSILIGDSIFSRIDLKNIEPVKDIH